MSNTLNVAKKEFQDLIGSRLMILVLFWFALSSIGAFYDTYSIYSSHAGDLADYYFYASPVTAFFDGLADIFRWYGPILAIVMGFVSMSSEIDGRALGTLLTKPLYRDTIINGKLLGNLAFLTVLVLATSVFYVVLVLVMTGNDGYAMGLFGKIPLVLLLSLLCMTFTFSLSMLITLLIRDQSLSLFTSLISYTILFLLLPSANVVAGIQDYFHSPALGDLISGLSPDKMFYMMLGSTDLDGILANSGFELFKLALFCIITITIAYIGFLRRDVS